MEEKRWGKVLSWVVLATVFLVGIFWIVFFAPAFANNKYIIPMRRDFYEKVLEKRYLPERLPYRVMVNEILDRHGWQMYGYKLMAKLVTVDYEREIFTLQDKDGRMWRVAYPQTPASDNPRENLRMFSEIAIDEQGQSTSKIAYMMGKVTPPADDTQYFCEGDIIMAMWMDPRKLPQILKERENPETPIILSYPGKIPLYKIVAKEK